MGTIMDQIDLALDTKKKIKNAIIEKGVNVDDSDTFASYAEKINNLGNEDWKPEPDWYDIEEILENDTEPYEGKMILLLTDCDTVTTIYGRNASKIVTSDGAEYENIQASGMQNVTYSHTWDKSKDKACKLGYKTRYIIWYYENTSVNISPHFYENPKYIVISGMNIDYFANNPPFVNLYLLESISFKNSIIINNNSINFSGCYLLEKIDNLKILNDGIGFNLSVTSLKEIPQELAQKCTLGYQNIMEMRNLKRFPSMKMGTNIGNNFNGLTNLERIDYLDTSNVTNFRNFALSDYRLKYIESLDLINATSISLDKPSFANAISLTTINNISNIKISGLNFSSCVLLSHDTLIKILNALYDYSAVEETYILTLGSTNVSKLTEEEIAAATEKGWTIS